MKKILLLLSAAVLTLSSCNKNDSPPITEEYIFCNGFLEAQGVAQSIIDVANYYVKEYKAGVTSHPEMTTVAEADGSTTLTIVFDGHAISNRLGGQMKVNINDGTGSEVKVITLTDLRSLDGTVTYGGTVDITNSVTNADIKTESVQLNGFSISATGSSTPAMLMNYTYDYKITGLSTSGASDDSFYWLNGFVNGTHATYGNFTGSIDSQISVFGSHYIDGQMTFSVQSLGGIASPIVMKLTSGALSISYNGTTTTY